GGTRNRAVIGGLQRYCPDWLIELGRTATQPDVSWEARALAAALSNYEQLEPGDREGICRRVLAFLDKATLAAAPVAAAPKPVRKVAAAKLVVSQETASPVHAPATPKEPRTASTHATKPAIFDAPVSRLPGVRGASATKLRNLGVETISDLLYLFPRRYSEIRKIADLTPGETQTVIGSVWRSTSDKKRTGLSVTTLVIADDTGTLPATIFRAGRGQYVPDYETGERIMLTGTVEIDMGVLRIKPSEIETRSLPEGDATGHLLPIYPLSGDLRQPWVRARVGETVAIWAGSLLEFVPAWIRDRWQLVDLSMAIRQIHRPSSWSLLQNAQRRLAFDELFLIQLGMLRRRAEYRHKQVAPLLPGTPGLLDQFYRSLPFSPTGAQQRVVGEILADMVDERPMMRLLQGEVGSGKTVVAAAALVYAAASGHQAAMMAPTEILVGQHFRTVSALMEALGPVARADGTERPVTVGALTGSIKGDERRRVVQGLAAGTLDVVVGTHALIEGGVDFAQLGLVVVDEQHRFGVGQRAALRQKGHSPHLLAMTATPIPRTLALTLYGDLDLSVVDEMPPGRQPVATRALGPDDRRRAYEFVRKRVGEGEQTFVVCPLIEESDKIEAKAATAEFERLRQDVFPNLRLGLLHGRMKSADKEKVMTEFRAGDVQVLVSTSVVEVGVDVPNATVMLVEGADRFGLAQLHQFRGRVGRGAQKAYCILLSVSPSDDAKQRLAALERTHNGFELAEEDLKLRGPGEFFGVRQSGLPDLRIAKLSDVLTMEEARAAAREVFARDPSLDDAELAPLRQQLERFWSGGGKLE
ncbi:MAG: ATP-dependent DNA helicase RecG, partial [Chloroflexota bacterium]